MKKLIILIIGIILCCSCSSIYRIQDQRILPESGRTVLIERFEMDEHYYISYTLVYGNSTYGFTVVHDPDCPNHGLDVEIEYE